MTTTGSRGRLMLSHGVSVYGGMLRYGKTAYNRNDALFVDGEFFSAQDYVALRANDLGLRDDPRIIRFLEVRQ